VDRHLHIISLTVPYPVSYGGVFDIFYNIVSLHVKGIKIHLHCFAERNVSQPALDEYCETVHYYPRKKGWRGFSFRKPYIVSSRISGELTARLLKDDHPIMLEGIHCSAPLFEKGFDKRRILLRLHNVEYRYYAGLFAASSSITKKLYYLWESVLLKKYERKIASRPIVIVAVSKADADLYQDEFDAAQVHSLPVFMGNKKVSAKPGTGRYCLYHGNLSVAENELAVQWLLDEIFADSSVPFVVAGKRPSVAIARKIQSHRNCLLIPDPSSEELEQLIADAQCHVLPSFNSTGVKLKLINALFGGRHCIVNPAAVSGTALQTACVVGNDARAFKDAVEEYFTVYFTEQDVLSRKSLLERVYDDEENCRRLIQWIW
jgi:glycosyltransferase involved in cell wall biosynthesis